jgi:hypothetical protein
MWEVKSVLLTSSTKIIPPLATLDTRQLRDYVHKQIILNRVRNQTSDIYGDCDLVNDGTGSRTLLRRMVGRLINND